MGFDGGGGSGGDVGGRDAGWQSARRAVTGVAAIGQPADGEPAARIGAAGPGHLDRSGHRGRPGCPRDLRDLHGRGISEGYPAPHQVRLAGDGEPARLMKLPARNRDHAAAGIRPLMGSEPGMRARMQAGE